MSPRRGVSLLVSDPVYRYSPYLRGRIKHGRAYAFMASILPIESDRVLGTVIEFPFLPGTCESAPFLSTTSPPPPLLLFFRRGLSSRPVVLRFLYRTARTHYAKSCNRTPRRTVDGPGRVLLSARKTELSSSTGEIKRASYRRSTELIEPGTRAACPGNGKTRPRGTAEFSNCGTLHVFSARKMPTGPSRRRTTLTNAERNASHTRAPLNGKYRLQISHRGSAERKEITGPDR